jgi:hypothetical protein
MDGKALLQQQVAEVHRLLESAIRDCPQEVLAKRLPGATITSIAAIYAHTVFGEDGLLNGLARGETPVYYKSGWAEKIGIAMPQGGLEPDWDVDMNLELFRQYAADVYRSTDEYLAGADDAEFARTIDPGFAPPMSVSTFVGNVLVWHVATHQGEISALKGIQGLNGLDMTH